MIRAVVLALVLALVPAAAGAGAARPRGFTARFTGAPPPPVALIAAPAHLVLRRGSRAAIRVTNSGARRVVVDVSRAGFALDLRGRPRIVRRGDARSAERWLTFRPRRFALRPHASVSLGVASRLPPRAEPGDHDALLLLTTRPLVHSRVAVRVQMGVVVVVRAPGRIVRRLELCGLRVRRLRGRDALELLVRNRGNITESLRGAHAVLLSSDLRRALSKLVANDRELRPRTSGIFEFRLPGWVAARGRITVRVVIPADTGRRPLRRTYRVRL